MLFTQTLLIRFALRAHGKYSPSQDSTPSRTPFCRSQPSESHGSRLFFAFHFRRMPGPLSQLLLAAMDFPWTNCHMDSTQAAFTFLQVLFLAAFEPGFPRCSRTRDSAQWSSQSSRLPDYHALSIFLSCSSGEPCASFCQDCTTHRILRICHGLFRPTVLVFRLLQGFSFFFIRRASRPSRQGRARTTEQLAVPQTTSREYF